jgi:predicted Fe-Mo cluster-binding NifX family protein
MIVAFSVSGKEIAVTFDFARRLLAVKCENGREIQRMVAVLDRVALVNRVKLLTNLGVEVLICGAISRPSAAMLTAAGIRIIPLVSGPVEEVLAAFLNDQVEDPRFLFPGCRAEDRGVLLARRGIGRVCQMPPRRNV